MTFESQNHAVPEEGVIMNVTRPSNSSTVTDAVCRRTTVLFGARNLTEGTSGPPKKDSTQVGTLVSGTASLGIEVD